MARTNSFNLIACMASAIALASFLFSCSPDSDTGTSENPVNVEITLSASPSPSPTRSLGDNVWTDQNATAGEFMRRCFVVAVQGGSIVDIIRSGEYAGEKASATRLTSRIPAGTTTFYSFANIRPEDVGIDTTATLPAPLPDGFARQTFTVRGNVLKAADFADGIPMSNCQTIDITPSTQHVSLSVVRMVAKVRMTFSNESAQPFRLKAVTLSDITDDTAGNLYLLPLQGDGGSLLPNIGPVATHSTRRIDLGDGLLLEAGGKNRQTVEFYVNESEANEPKYFVVGAETDQSTASRRMAMMQWGGISRGDLIVLPIRLNDYRVECSVEQFTAIGVLPDVESSPEQLTVRFHGYGEFHIRPSVRRLSDGKLLTPGTDGKDGWLFESWTTTELQPDGGDGTCIYDRTPAPVTSRHTIEGIMGNRSGYAMHQLLIRAGGMDYAIPYKIEIIKELQKEEGTTMFKRLTLSLTIMLCALTAGAQTFAHYVGHANTSLDSRGMQRVSEVHYYYYVDDNRTSFALTLPLLNYTSSGNDTEPRNYFRWYDYTTDAISANLTANGNRLQAIADTEGRQRGLFAWDLYSNGKLNPSQTTIGVTYNPPAGANDKGWTGDIIACDVSRYDDFGGKGGEMLAEPTLSIRYIFHILPGRKLAEDIVNATSTDMHGKYSDLTLEDNKRIVFGAKDHDARFMVRTNMPQTRYYFYALKNTNRHVYSADDAHKITSADFDRSKMYASDYIMWRAYDQTKTKYTDLLSFYKQILDIGLSMNVIQNNSNGWRTLDGARTTKPAITFGSVVYLVAFARSGKSGPYAPVANYEILFQNTCPKTRNELIADGDNERMVSYLDSHYQQAMKPISFDDDNGEMDYSAPTTPDNNMSRLPSKWDRRSYGFVYRELKAFTPSSTTVRK